MSQSELLKKVVGVLTEAGIPYMLTGSLVSSLQGEPRSTHDVDLVVGMSDADADRLMAAFPAPDFYVPAAAVRDAIRDRRMFNLLDIREGDKVDFWLLTDDSFDRSRFARKKMANFDRLKVWVSAPEDTILAKLRWAEMSGGSEKQFGDALRVYEVQRCDLDLAYLSHWIEQLGLTAIWARLQASAETMD